MLCSKCGETLARVPRKGIERWRYSAVYACRRCDLKVGSARWWDPLLSSHRCCPKCGGGNIERLSRRDEIDPMYKNPLSWLQGLLGAKLWWCPLCRIQFYDLRRAPSGENR